MRPSTIAGAARPPATAPNKTGYKVTSQSKKDEIGIATLVGDYEEKGTNHGKKFYQKVQKIAGHEDVKVFMYYWDSRDGAEFSGWWFGDQVGGSQVWARCASHAATPPKVGWKVPWDAPTAEAGVLTVEPAAGAAGAAAPRPTVVGAFTGAGAPAPRPVGALGGAAQNPAALKARVAAATSKVKDIETTAQAALAEAKALTATSDAATVKCTNDELLAQQKALTEIQRSLTQDISEARKGGAPAVISVTELSKLSPRLRLLQTGLAAEVNKLKQPLARASAGVAIAKKQTDAAAVSKAAEEKDSKEFEESLPVTRELITSAEDAVEAIQMMAAPLVSDPPDDDGDILDKATEEVELAAADAQAKITEARSKINQRLQAARKFAPDTRKTALAEFATLQQKLSECQKKLIPFRAFKKEFKARVQARKSLQELTDKLATQELEVEKVKMMSSAAESGQMTEDEISSAEKLVQPAKASLEGMLRTLDLKLRGADGAMKDELSGMKDKILAVKKDLDAVVAVLSKQRQSIATSEMLKTASEKVDKAEESLGKCQESEMPFLKGIEVLPGDESSKAIGDCEKAAQQSQAAVNQATSFLKAKMAEARRLQKDLAASVTEELTSHQTRLDGASKKLAEFKKETSERKMAALLAEVIDGVTNCERKVEALGKASQVFTSDSLDSVSTEELKEALEKAGAAEKEASTAMLEARRVHSAKQKEAKGADASSALQKLQARIGTAQQDLVKFKRATASGEKIIKGKAVLSEEEGKVKKIEEEVAAAEKKVKPGEEEAALGIEEAKVSDSEVETMSKAFVEGQQALKTSVRLVEANAASAPASLKVLLQKLVDRSKATLAKITELMGLTKDQRERVTSEAYVREGKAKVAEIEACLERVNEAELPFLKGIEVVVLQEANASIAESEAAAAALQAAVGTARTFIASKNLELRKLGEAASKPAAEEFSQLTEQINATSAKLGAFKKDTEGRKKTALMQEAGEKVAAAEAGVKKMAEVTEPFSNGEGERGDDECMKLVEQMKESAGLISEASNFVAARFKDVAGNSAQTTLLKELQGKLREAQIEMAKHKKVASVHEAKYTAKKAMEDAAKQLEGMEAELKKAAEAAAPVTEDGSARFLVGTCVDMVATALRLHMKAKSLSHEDVYKEFTSGAAGLSKEAFDAHLAKLPETLGREEVEFLPERREAMFAYIDADTDGNISLAEFKSIFFQRFHCIKEISITDGFDVSKSKTLCKVAAGTDLETVHGSATDESNGLTRVEITKAGDDEKSGFVTLHGNQGTKFCEPVTAFHTFCKDLDKTLAAAHKATQEVSTWFNTKIKELSAAPRDGPLGEAKTELAKLRSKAPAGLDQVSKLRSKVAVAKKDFAKLEASERSAHVERKERREADAITAPAVAKVEALEVEAKSLLESSKTLRELNNEEVLTFATPLSVVEACEKELAIVMKLVEEGKATVKEQVEKCPKVPRGAMADARRELAKLSAKCESTRRQCTGALDGARTKCRTIVNARSAEVSSLLRKQAQEKGVVAEAFFSHVAPAGEERISEDAFCRYVAALPGADFQSEHVRLLCQHLEKGGISRRRFQAFIQQYFAVVKGIAITDSFEIASAKTLRKAEVEEVIELLEGPCPEPKIGISRIRGKSLTDGQEGWISLKGNQGTPFLQEVEKPYYSVQAATALESEFKSEGAASLVRSLKADEVLELIEGPRKQTFEPGMRVKGKAISDGAIGWFTAKDKTGTVFAEADSKYYACTSSVAMTDNLDIKECKVVRKLVVGELFTVEEGPVKIEDAGIIRVKGTTMKDDVVGWITIKGNAGTTYAEASSKHFCVLQDVPLQKKFPSASPGDEVRMLAKGEAMQVLEGPKEETYPAETRIKGRTLADGVTGWITSRKATVKPWTPFYKCKAAASMHDAVKAEGATAVRDIQAGETVELLEGPCAEGDALRMRGRAEKDGAVGWVTIRDAEGKRFFES